MLSIVSKVRKQFVVVFNAKCITNIPQYPEELLQYNQEEADTLILLQAKNVTGFDPFTELYVASIDMEVRLLLIYYYPQLCASPIYESIGPWHANAIFGFHVFTECNQIGHFYGTSKLECFRIYTDCQ